MRFLVVNGVATEGGVTRSFFNCLKMLKNEGHQAVAVVPANFQFPELVAADAWRTVFLKDLQRGGHLALPWQALQLSRLAHRHAVDRIVVNNGRHVPWLRRIERSLPIICIYHGGKLDRVLAAHRILTINDEQRDLLLQRGMQGSEVAVVDNILPIDELPVWKQRAAGDVPVIGTLRLFEPAKGVDVLVDALGVLKRRGVAFRALLGSDGSQRDKLTAMVNEYQLTDAVTFSGWVADSNAFYDRLNIYVLPSRHEEWGIGIVEAQSNSLPVVATDCLGPKRLIGDGRNGLLVPREDPEAMADAIERLIVDPELYGQIARNGYLSAERYLMKNVQKDYVSFLAGPISEAAR